MDQRIADHVLRQLQRAAPTAVAVLCRVMRDPKAPASSQVRAAGLVLATILQAAVNQDLELEVAQLQAERSAVQGTHAPQGTKNR